MRRDLQPMLASLAEAPLVDGRFAYEAKYDGIRALVEITPGGAPGGVTIWSRNGNDKTGQFPEIVAALRTFARRLKARVLLDGEIVALDGHNEPTGFQALQGRIHLTRHADAARRAGEQPAAFVAFDVLRDGEMDVRPLPLTARRARLERILGNAGSRHVRLSRWVPGDGRPLYQEAETRGWEGIIAKHLDSPYRSGQRSDDWRKVKILNRQECVVGGYTEPRGSRGHFGALLLGVWEDGGLEYVGHTGGGFDDAELAHVATALAPLRTDRCPFRMRPRANERPHWVEPRLVVEVKFLEWTAEGKMRAPIYVGLRDDLDPRSVRRESGARAQRPVTPRPPARRIPGTTRGAPAAPSVRDFSGLSPGLERVLQEITTIEARRGAGTLRLPGGRLEVAHLHKVFWPESGITKGELMRYYVGVSPRILPAIAERPLIMRRFPNGLPGKAFYQQRAPAAVPRGVPVAVMASDRVVPSRLVGGSLLTLLFMTQLAVISQDPWFSRVGSPDDADHAVLDLDPMPGVPFSAVVDVARWVHDELERLGVPSVPKTSGAEGLHIYVPLAPRTSYETARIFCEIVATLVAQRHSKLATVERALHARGRRVYVDYLQNSRGKSLATAYSARANAIAGASAPLTWEEVHAGVDRRDFTIRTLPARLRDVGDLWARLRTSAPADLTAVLEPRTATRRSNSASR